MKVHDLVSALVADENDEGPVIFLDIVVDEGWETRVELLAHDGEQTRKGEKKKRRAAGLRRAGSRQGRGPGWKTPAVAAGAAKI